MNVSYLYVFGVDAPPYKVGVTDSPKVREAGLRDLKNRVWQPGIGANAKMLFVKAIVRTAKYEAEARVHYRLAEHKAKMTPYGQVEWFYADLDAIRSVIDEVADMHKPCEDDFLPKPPPINPPVDKDLIDRINKWNESEPLPRKRSVIVRWAVEEFLERRGH